MTPLQDVDPHNSPREETCPIDDLPDELLAYVFQLGVETEQEGDEDSDSESSNENQWEDIDDDKDSDVLSADGTSCNSSSLTLNRVISIPTDSDLDDDDDDRHRDTLPFQVLVSHVCRRWRSVALNSYRFWTILTFCRHPRLVQAKEYISRSNGLPLTIELDCSTDDDLDEQELEELSDSDLSEEEKNVLSLDELDQILELLQPAISQWGTFIFHASHHDYVRLLMSKLHRLPAALCLESFQVHIYEEWDDSVFIPAKDDTFWLPFHGQAPNLKEAVFWGIHIDWEGALPNFLSGLRNLELSYLTQEARPTYAAFAEIIKNSPELRGLTLSLAGPMLPDDVAFDSDEAWGPVPLAIPSLTKLVLQFHDPKYAAILVQHLYLPNVTHLVLNFDEEDYSGFVQTLANPVKGRSQSLLRQLSYLKISGLPCDITSVEILLSQLSSLQSLNLKLFGADEEVIYEKLVDPWSLRIGPASSSLTHSPRVDIPKVFCPKLEEITTVGLNGPSIKTLVIARRDAGAPLKRVYMATSQDSDVLTDDERWIKENVEELYFFDPSDSEEDYDTDDPVA